MQQEFSVDHGPGSVTYNWHPQGRMVASTGSNCQLYITSARGKLLHQFALPRHTRTLGVEWSADGTMLAVLQEGAHGVLLWKLTGSQLVPVTMTSKKADSTSANSIPTTSIAAATATSAKSDVVNILQPCYIKWAKYSQCLAIGTSRGEVYMYDHTLQSVWLASAKHRKAIQCGDWNYENKFAFASEDRQITIVAHDGKTLGQVKVKVKPTCVQFGGHVRCRENTVSVCMDRKTILLYNLDDPKNALELAFQQRYGHIVAFRWFKEGCVMVGFSRGYLVVISTHMRKIQREQFCARFHQESLRDIRYSPARDKVATCGDQCIKIVDMDTWQEHKVHYLEEDGADIENLRWTADGRHISVSTRQGVLKVFLVDPSPLQPFIDGAPNAVLTFAKTRFSVISFLLSGLFVLCVVLLASSASTEASLQDISQLLLWFA